MPELPPSMESPKRSRLWKWLKRLGFGLAALVTLAALALAIENYRGKRAWMAYKAQLEAQGEVLEASKLAPAPIPEDQNFARTPLIRPFTETKVDPATGQLVASDTNACDQVLSRFHWAMPIGEGTRWRVGKVSDLAEWQRQWRAVTNASPSIRALQQRPPGTSLEDLRFLLEQHRPDLDELRAALAKPAANYNTPVQLESGLLLNRMSLGKSLSRPLRFAATVELAGGQTDAAMADIMALWRLPQLVAPEPLLITALVRISLLETAMQPLWEGLVRHQWSEGQLVQFETALAPMDWIAEMADSLRGERVYSLAMLAQFPTATGAMAEGAGPMGTGPWRFFSAMLYQNQRHIARMFQDVLLTALDTNRGVVHLEALETAKTSPDLKRWRPYTMFSSMLLPALVPSGERAARAQATLNLARVAVALERHRLAEGKYPATLEALVPRLLAALPPDPVNGQPLVYRPTDPGAYILYSLGLNRRDDGGTVALNKSGEPVFNKPEGDWVWHGAPVE